MLENVAVIYPRMPQKLKDILLQLRGEDDTENKYGYSNQTGSAVSPVQLLYI